MVPPLSEEGIYSLCITLLRLLKNENHTFQEYRFKPKRSSVTGKNERYGHVYYMDENGRYGQKQVS